MERIAWEERTAPWDADEVACHKTNLLFVDAVNEVFGARSDLVNGRYEDIFNGYFIEAARGTLVTSLGAGGTR